MSGVPAPLFVRLGNRGRLPERFVAGDIITPIHQTLIQLEHRLSDEHRNAEQRSKSGRRTLTAAIAPRGVGR